MSMRNTDYPSALPDRSSDPSCAGCILDLICLAIAIYVVAHIGVIWDFLTK